MISPLRSGLSECLNVLVHLCVFTFLKLLMCVCMYVCVYVDSTFTHTFKDIQMEPRWLHFSPWNFKIIIEARSKFHHEFMRLKKKVSKRIASLRNYTKKHRLEKSLEN